MGRPAIRAVAAIETWSWWGRRGQPARSASTPASWLASARSALWPPDTATALADDVDAVVYTTAGGPEA
ncbi:MAG: hypothetical protein R2699_11650 [Acidimicrobiales bacterium]